MSDETVQTETSETEAALTAADSETVAETTPSTTDAPEAEGQEEPTGDEGETEAPAETDEPPPRDEVAELRAKLNELAPLADFGRQALESQRQTQAPPAPRGPDPVLLRGALEVLVGPGIAPDKRAAEFAKFPIEVQRAAADRVRKDDEAALERLLDPDGYDERRLLPLIERSLRPLAQKLALDHFDRAYPDLSSPEDRAALGELVKQGAPIKMAVDHLRLLKAGVGSTGNKTQTRAAEEDARAVRESRRRAAPPKNSGGGKKQVKPSGFYYEDTIRDLSAEVGEE